MQEMGWRDVEEYRATFGEPDYWDNGLYSKIQSKQNGYYTYWCVRSACLLGWAAATCRLGPNFAVDCGTHVAVCAAGVQEARPRVLGQVPAQGKDFLVQLVMRAAVHGSKTAPLTCTRCVTRL